MPFWRKPDPEFKRIYKKFRAKGKTRRESKRLAQRYLETMAYKEKHRVVSTGEAFEQTKPKTLREKMLQDMLITILKSPQLAGAVKRAIEERKTNDWQRQRQIIDLIVDDIVSIKTLSADLLDIIRLAFQLGSIRQMRYKLSLQKARELFVKNMMELNYKNFSALKSSQRKEIVGESARNLDGAASFSYLAFTIANQQSELQRELHSTTDQKRMQEIKEELIVFNILDKIFFNPRNFGYIVTAFQLALEKKKPMT